MKPACREQDRCSVDSGHGIVGDNAPTASAAARSWRTVLGGRLPNVEDSKQQEARPAELLPVQVRRSGERQPLAHHFVYDYDLRVFQAAGAGVTSRLDAQTAGAGTAPSRAIQRPERQNSRSDAAARRSRSRRQNRPCPGQQVRNHRRTRSRSHRAVVFNLPRSLRERTPPEHEIHVLLRRPVG